MLHGKQCGVLSRRHCLMGSGLLCGQMVQLRSQARVQPVNREVDNNSSPLVQKLLKKSTELREERKKERLQEFYQRNFTDYFEFEMGNKQSNETREKISTWLKENKQCQLKICN
eukprot:TRINITY_DN1305_c0_g1_i1.p3 TRINITY_DN1305_c0_g1~~TRINITY_DN1305_c0_g1_i1.p3  ORF type:complete len:114 (+),score=8.32 TRINITY_DN1305_c0_g1_i1:87-428(+)